jgi:magnesium transporter
MAVTNTTGLEDLLSEWHQLPKEERFGWFRGLPRNLREDLFLDLSSYEQSELVLAMPPHEQRTWMRVLAPDDAADLIQQVEDEDQRKALLDRLDETNRRDVQALLAYAEDDAGGLMSPRFARLRPDMTVDHAITYLRLQGRQMETVYYCYVLDNEQRLLGVVSFRELFASEGSKRIDQIMERDVVSVLEDTDQEEVARVIGTHKLLAVPVVDTEGRVKGIVTVDDVVDVVQEEASEDIQKMGAVSALEVSYMETSFWEMIRRRVGWLSVLFLGQLLTATAMDHYEDEIARAVVLVVFLPLIISSGGNSGSQASTLVIRAMALGEIKLRDWTRILLRELPSGLTLGVVLAVLGFVRILVWEWMGMSYGEYYYLIGGTLALSLVGVVLFGTVTGAMLPLALRALRLDPATASAPFVATLADVMGVIIYFSMASVLLRGTLL